MNEKVSEERDFVVFEDDDGKEFELDVIDYFTHEDNEYAVLMDLSEIEDTPEDQETEADIYIMQIVPDGEFEEFRPVDDQELFDTLCAVVEKRFKEGELTEE